jgi:hypothetical protein
LSAILEIVPLQLLAYQIAVRRGCDVDQPQNLAKSGDRGVEAVSFQLSAIRKTKRECPHASRFCDD